MTIFQDHLSESFRWMYIYWIEYYLLFCKQK